jgi:hypothetical protein
MYECKIPAKSAVEVVEKRDVKFDAAANAGDVSLLPGHSLPRSFQF